MTEQEYMQYTESIEGHTFNFENAEVIHGVIGISSEAGELVDAIKKQIVYHQPLNKDNIKEELGDLLHYMTYLLRYFGWTLEDLMDNNVDKLTKRYPNGFNFKDAMLRRDKQ